MFHPSFSKLIKIIEAEQDYHQVPLPAKRNEFEPVFSKEAMDIHYGVLYKNYVEKALSGDTDPFQLGRCISAYSSIRTNTNSNFFKYPCAVLSNP